MPTYYYGRNSHLLLMGYASTNLMELYSEFISRVTWYRMYCAGRLGKDKNDYLRGYYTLDNTYSEIRDFLDFVHDKTNRTFDQHLTQVLAILEENDFQDGHIGQIAALIYEFESKHEEKFRHKLIDLWLTDSAKTIYPAALYNQISDLVETFEHDATIVAAFKYLDRHLQSLLNVKPYEYYGEGLMNHAFAPNMGGLQLSTSSNEQVALRNFFSGANGLFRNLSAHRSIFGTNSILSHSVVASEKVDSVSPTILLLVGIMADIATGLFIRKVEPQVMELLRTVAKVQKWDTTIVKREKAWLLGEIKNKRKDSPVRYHLSVSLDEDAEGCFFKVNIHKSTPPSSINDFIENLRQDTGLRVIYKSIR